MASPVTIKFLLADLADLSKLKDEINRRLRGYAPEIEQRGPVLILTIKERYNTGKHVGAIQVRCKKIFKALPQRFWYSLENGGVVHVGSAGYNDWWKNIPRITLEAGTNNERTVPDYQWNHKLIRFPQALAKLNDFDPAQGVNATDIKVYQFDTGWSDHPDIHDYPGYLSADKPEGQEESICTIHPHKSEPVSTDPRDSLDSYLLASKSFQRPGHGSATAFTVIGQEGVPQKDWPSTPEAIENFDSIKTQNLGKGLFPYVKYTPIRVGETVTFAGRVGSKVFKGVGNPRGMIKALDHVISKGGHVVTMSMGGEPELFKRKKVIREAIERAYNAGIIFVAAAGNARIADKFRGVVQPAQHPFTICACGVEPHVDLVNKTHRYLPWAQSCDGPPTDIAAPAKYIYTVFKTKTDLVKNDELKKVMNNGNLYKWGGATSQATAHVAAAAALWRHHYKDLLNDPFFQEEGKRWRIVEAFRYALYASRFVPDYWDKRTNRLYKGILDVERLIDPAFGPNTEDCRKYIGFIRTREMQNRFKIFQMV